MTTPESNRPLTGEDVKVSYDDMVAIYNERTGPMRRHRDDYASWSQVPISVQSAVIAYDAARRGGSNEAPMSERIALSIAGMMRQALTATSRGFDDAIDDDLRRLRERLSTAERQRDEAMANLLKVQNAAKTLHHCRDTELQHLRENATFDHRLRAEHESLMARDSMMTDLMETAERQRDEAVRALRSARWYVADHQDAQPNDESRDLLAVIDDVLK